MIDKCLTIDLSAVGSDIPTQLGIGRPTLTSGNLVKTAGV